jgi:hypothetical protein
VDFAARKRIAQRVVKQVLSANQSEGTSILTVAVPLGPLRNDESVLFRAVEEKLATRDVEHYSISPRSDVSKSIESVMSNFLGMRNNSKTGKAGAASSRDEEVNSEDEESESLEAIRRCVMGSPSKKKRDADDTNKLVVFLLEGLPEYRQSVLEGFVGDIA